ncbi:Solute carrier family 35 member G1 [Holothuria leucospilota]|uniref:Solute carrier family 35 member G1 n=1 Tax=Holothuria leucospilota TaxID=206669 RepID=A0A9Q1HKC7_HOLLE|nr:Solute carrier family 35 member G1 [Holothuria leucospilota]
MDTYFNIIRKYSGVIFSVSYGIILATQLSLGKLLVASHVHPTQIVFFRCLIHLFCIAPSTFQHETVAFTAYDTTVYFLCALTGSFSWIFTAYTFLYLEVGDSTGIELGATVVFTAIMAHVCLSEYVDKFDVIILVVDVAGIILISKPAFLFGGMEHYEQNHLKAVLMVSVSALFSSLWPMFVKNLSKMEKLYFMLLNFLHGAIGVPLTLLCSLFLQPWFTSSSAIIWTLTLLFSVVCLIQTAVQASALHLTDAKTVAVSSTISTVLTYVIQLTAFGAAFDWVVISGAFLIAVTVICSQCRTGL